ncbi:MAG: DUF3050 domain-containing protein [Planctomycetota bacterium]
MTDLLIPARVEAAKRRLEEHAAYRSVHGIEGLRAFMQHHCVCVLDFMTLLKTLQIGLTCARTPWVPPTNPTVARFINEIVLDEESDAAFGDHPLSHYEWYLAAMDQVGADTGPIREVEARLRRGVAWADALAGSGLPQASIDFASTTFRLAEGPLHVVAAVFFHGREDVIPRMFLPLVRSLREQGLTCDLLVSYLERHIEVDGGDHGPLARRMLDELFEGSDDRRAEAARAAERALGAREALWDEVARVCGRLDGAGQLARS